MRHHFGDKAGVNTQVKLFLGKFVVAGGGPKLMPSLDRLLDDLRREPPASRAPLER